MKNHAAKIFLLLLTLTLGALPFPASAEDTSKAMQDMKKVQSVMKTGEIATSSTGFAMKAQFDGKDWVATTMMRTEDTGRILGLKGDETLSLPFSRSRMKVGQPIKFGENRAVDLFVDDDVSLYAGLVGEMTYTKVDETSAEGTFFFTATSRNSPKKIEVTGGTFRVLFGKKAR